MGKNTGIPYELLVQMIFDKIVNENYANNINVLHNQIIEGKDYHHQIDVYWEFEIGGLTYRTIIQAKDWNSNVPLEKVLAFKAILDDLPHGTIGIMVSKIGFQYGAIEYAKKNGIILYTFRIPTIADFNTELSQYNIKMGIKQMSISNLVVKVDKDWIVDNNFDINNIQFDSFNTNMYKKTDIDYTPLTSLHDYLFNISYSIGYEAIPVEKTFEDIYFNDINNNYIKISGFSGVLGLLKENEFIEFKNTDMIGYFLKDVINDTIKTFSYTGRRFKDDEWGVH